MVRFILQYPTLFFGLDAVVEIIAGIVALLIVIMSYRYARLAKDHRYGQNLGGGFLLIFLAFLSQIIGTFLIYKQFQLPNAQSGINVGTILFAGQAAHAIFFIAGLVILTLWALKIKDVLHQALVLVLTLFLAVIGIWNNVIIHLVALTLLLFICVRFWTNACEKSCATAWEVSMAFGFIALARIAFLLEPFHSQWYAAGHLAQLLGYLILLVVLIQILRR